MGYGLFTKVVACFFIATCMLTFASPLVVPTERYNREILRLMMAEASRIATELKLDEQLPITRTHVTLLSLVHAAKSYGYIGTCDTRNYTYIFYMHDGGIVCSGLDRIGYKDFIEARNTHVFPISRHDSNRAFQVAIELMDKINIDVESLNRDCVVRIHFPHWRRLFSREFAPIYMVVWTPKNQPFMPGEGGGLIEFIEPLRKVRSVHADLKFNRRKPLQTVNLVKLLTPENSLESVLYEIEMATNYVRRIEFLKAGNPPEALLRSIWASWTDAPFPSNILHLMSPFETFLQNRRCGLTNSLLPTPTELGTNTFVR